MLVSGVPLVGKTTLTSALVDHLPAETLHIENDPLRALVVDAMGREEPRFDGDESLATYEAARRLVEQGLETGLHVVHDATNLRERDRRETYAIADQLGAPVRVLFVDAPRPVLEARADEEGPAAQQALDALGDRDPEPSTATRPHRVLDGTRDPGELVREILDDDVFAPLRGTAAAP